MFLTACMEKAEKILTGELGQQCSFPLTARGICLTEQGPDTILAHRPEEEVEGFCGSLRLAGEIRAGDPVAQGQDEVGGGAKSVFLLAWGLLCGAPESSEHSSHHSGWSLTPSAQHEQDEFLPLLLSAV